MIYDRQRNYILNSKSHSVKLNGWNALFNGALASSSSEKSFSVNEKL